jgi:hypothetical protein
MEFEWSFLEFFGVFFGARIAREARVWMTLKPLEKNKG